MIIRQYVKVTYCEKISGTFLCGHGVVFAYKTTVHRAVYHTNASVNLCLSQSAWTTRTKRKEHSIIFLYAAVNVKRKN